MKLSATSLLLLITPFVGGGFLVAEEKDSNVLGWSTLPPMPPASGKIKQAGLAGPFAGIHQGAMLVAGGANFPNRSSWLGGKKIWWDDVYVLEKDATGKPKGAWFT